MSSLDSWLQCQQHRDDPVGEIARALEPGMTVAKLRKLGTMHPSALAGVEQAVSEFAAA